MTDLNNGLIASLSGRLKERALTVASAESLTAGRVAEALTSLPGSSAYFQGGIVAYSNQLKVELLGVPFELILRHGAVSEACARAMAEGLRRKLSVDLAVATTGIAGPGGGSAEKPVGLVWLAACDSSRTVVSRRIFDGGREAVSAAATVEALRLLLSVI